MARDARGGRGALRRPRPHGRAEVLLIRAEPTRPSLLEALVVWALLATAALAVLVTYARLPPEELWNVSVGGVRGGLGRALVLLNFPVALCAIPLAGLAAARLGTRLGDALALAALPLCLVVAVPGVMDGEDADAKLANVLPAVGVGLAVAVTALSLRARGVGAPPARIRFDRVRLAIGTLVLLLAIPPGMLAPSLSVAWLLILLAAAGVYALLRRTTAPPLRS